MSYQYDLVVIGAGPGGYVAAIRSAQLGMKTAVVEKWPTLGGTCLNIGCIPSKALLDSSEHFHQAKEKFAIHGIKTGPIKIDMKQMIKRKNDVVEQTTGGIDFLFKKNKIDRYTGFGSFIDPHTIQVDGEKKEKITADKVIIATGSDVMPLPPVPFDSKRIISSTEALDLTEVPGEMIVIGGGVIGMEMGSVYARLGTKITVVEFMSSIIPTMDRELGRNLQRSLKKLGFSFNLSTKVTGAKVVGKKVNVTAEDKRGKEIKLTADYVLVSIGRRPYTDKLNLDKIGVKTDQRGFIDIDQHWQTACDNVYAIGDVVPGPMLAHKAEDEGTAVVEYIAGQKPHIDYNLIPGVVYTWPEVAACGQTEEQLKEAGIAYKKGSFPFKASGRARASEESEGLIKVLSDEKTDELLGVHMIGPRAADMIAEAVVAMEFRASAEDIGRICHAHPTFTEAFKEAALMATDNRPIHI